MKYKIDFVYNEYSDGSGKFSSRASAATILERPEVYIHFAHHDFDFDWNEKTRRQERVDAEKYFGGMGEGSTFGRWQDALLTSLYDMYQVTEGFQDGDSFTATYEGQTATFHCSGVHVIEGGVL